MKIELYDVLLPAIILISIVICIVCTLPTYDASRWESKDEKKHHSPYIFLKLRKSWRQAELITLISEYAFIFLSFAATVLLIYILVENHNPDHYKAKVIIYSVLSLLFSLVSAIIKPMKLAEGNRAAFVGLNKAILEYEHSFYVEGSVELQVLYDNMVKSAIDGEQHVTRSRGL